MCVGMHRQFTGKRKRVLLRAPPDFNPPSHRFFRRPGPGDPFCRFDRARLIRVRAKVIFMRVGVSRMIPGQDWFLDRLVWRMGKRVLQGMVAGVLKVPVPVHARPFCIGDLLCCLLALGWMSW